jgi:hypothetical protein
MIHCGVRGWTIAADAAVNGFIAMMWLGTTDDVNIAPVVVWFFTIPLRGRPAGRPYN